MAKHVKRAVLSAFVVAIALPMLAATGCSSANSPVASVATPPTSSSPSRIATASGSDLRRVYSVGETVTVGPYTVCLTRSRLLSHPKPSTDLPAIPKIPRGKLLGAFVVTVANPALDAAEAVPMPDLQGFRMQDGRGSAIASDSTGIGFAPPPLPGGGAGRVGGPPARDIQAGDSMQILPLFFVPSDAESLTLFYAPLEELPDMVVKFKVK
jgi:hypothetical protein